MEATLPSGTPAMVERADGAVRGLVVVPDIWGLRDLYAQMCSDLAARTGWTVVAIEPFPEEQLPGLDHPDGFDARSDALRRIVDRRLLDDAIAGAELSGCEHVAVIGFCMGGMYALKAAAEQRFDRVAAFYGMIRVPDAWSGPGQGQPLDALSRRGDTEVMAIIGEVDGWTPPDDVEALRATGAHVVTYPDADHGFVHDPSRPAHRADDAADAWERVLAFLGD